MTSKKLSLIFTATFGVLCLIILFGAYKITTSLQNRSKTLASLKSDYSADQQKQDQILQNKNDLKTYAGLNTIAQSVVPHDKNADVVTLQIIDIARKSGIDIDSGSGITFPTSNLGGAPGEPAVNNSLSQLTKVSGMSGVYELPITVQQDSPVPYSSFLTFLSNLQQNRRTATVSNISITPGKSTGVTFTITIIEYIKP